MYFFEATPNFSFVPSRACTNAQTLSGDNARVSWARNCDPLKILAAKIEELHNCLITVKNHSKMTRNKVKLRIGYFLDVISSFILLVEDSVLFLMKRRVTIHKMRSENTT